MFKADLAYVAPARPASGMIHFPYQYGDRSTSRCKYGEGLTSKIIETGKPLIINSESDRRTLELGAKHRRPPGAVVPRRADHAWATRASA